jgi:outer membrane protein assembly factor BamB
VRGPFLALAAAACSAPAPTHRPALPRVAHGPAAHDVTIDLTRPGMALRAVAAAGDLAFAALAGGGKTVVVAYRGDTLAWQADVAGEASAAAAGDGTVYVAVAARAPLRGDPGALLVALDAASGATRWQVALDGSQWSRVRALAARPGGVVAGGAFAGTLRVGSRVVTSAGESDGFVAAIGAGGELDWLVRMGGNGQDAIDGVAVRGDRVVIGGTFAPGAELLGHTLHAIDERSLFGDAFAAELDAGGRFAWATPFGGKADDTVVGAALDEVGRALVAGAARDVVAAGSAKVAARGPADALVVVFDPRGAVERAQLIGGSDFDGASAVAAIDDRSVIGGFFSGELPLGGRTLRAGGGDDAFIALLDANGSVVGSWQVGGQGREEVVGLAAIPGGFVAGVAHTADAKIDGGRALPPPADPMTGAALILRGVAP